MLANKQHDLNDELDTLAKAKHVSKRIFKLLEASLVKTLEKMNDESD